MHARQVHGFGRAHPIDLRNLRNLAISQSRKLAITPDRSPQSRNLAISQSHPIDLRNLAEERSPLRLGADEDCNLGVRAVRVGLEGGAMLLKRTRETGDHRGQRRRIPGATAVGFAHHGATAVGFAHHGATAVGFAHHGATAVGFAHNGAIIADAAAAAHLGAGRSVSRAHRHLRRHAHPSAAAPPTAAHHDAPPTAATAAPPFFGGGGGGGGGGG